MIHSLNGENRISRWIREDEKKQKRKKCVYLPWFCLSCQSNFASLFLPSFGAISNFFSICSHILFTHVHIWFHLPWLNSFHTYIHNKVWTFLTGTIIKPDIKRPPVYIHLMCVCVCVRTVDKIRKFLFITHRNPDGWIHQTQLVTTFNWAFVELYTFADAEAGEKIQWSHAIPNFKRSINFAIRTHHFAHENQEHRDRELQFAHFIHTLFFVGNSVIPIVLDFTMHNYTDTPVLRKFALHSYCSHVHISNGVDGPSL